MKPIKLYNRDGANVQLTPIDDTHYVFEGDKFAFEYMGVGFKDEIGGELAYVDPAGGPMISLGTPIKNTEVIKIDWNDETKKYIITTKEKIKSCN